MGYRPLEGTSEARLEETPTGKRPSGPGWFVVNAREAPWYALEGAGKSTDFEPADHRFEQLGINIHVLEPGEPSGRYHAEQAQEGFLVISGECRLIVEGEERTMRAWDFFHCPPGTHHIIVGAGEGPCTVVMVGHRPDGEIDYAADRRAVTYNAAAPSPTNDSREAYADWPQGGHIAYEPGWLPDVDSR